MSHDTGPGERQDRFMCLGVYIASSRELPTVEWDPERPGFNVTPLSPAELPVRQQFSLDHVVYAGAHTRCGCGFSDSDADGSAVDESRVRLVAYLGAAARSSELEVFVCWEGDFAERPQAVLKRQVPELAASYEWLEELALTHIPRLAS